VKASVEIFVLSQGNPKRSHVSIRETLLAKELGNAGTVRICARVSAQGFGFRRSPADFV
jgi:hypothetical protein